MEKGGEENLPREILPELATNAKPKFILTSQVNLNQ
jgi:hypothetical protein